MYDCNDRRHRSPGDRVEADSRQLIHHYLLRSGEQQADFRGFMQVATKVDEVAHGCQHIETLRASPPAAVSLYLELMSSPVCRIVSMA